MGHITVTASDNIRVYACNDQRTASEVLYGQKLAYKPQHINAFCLQRTGKHYHFSQQQDQPPFFSFQGKRLQEFTDFFTTAQQKVNIWTMMLSGGPPKKWTGKRFGSSNLSPTIYLDITQSLIGLRVSSSKSKQRELYITQSIADQLTTDLQQLAAGRNWNQLYTSAVKNHQHPVTDLGATLLARRTTVPPSPEQASMMEARTMNNPGIVR